MIAILLWNGHEGSIALRRLLIILRVKSSTFMKLCLGSPVPTDGNWSPDPIGRRTRIWCCPRPFKSSHAVEREIGELFHVAELFGSFSSQELVEVDLSRKDKVTWYQKAQNGSAKEVDSLTELYRPGSQNVLILVSDMLGSAVLSGGYRRTLLRYQMI